MMLEFWQLFLNPFLNSSSLIAIVTAVAGIEARRIYYKQKSDNKQEAANIIFIEVTNAERNLTTAYERFKEDGQFQASIFIMKNESWSKYKYLFLQDFDRDEWDAIDLFYKKTQLYDEAVAANSAVFAKNEEQIRINVHSMAADAFEKIVVLEGVDRKLDERMAAYNKREEEIEDYTAKGFTKPHYVPQKYTDDAKLYLETVEKSLSKTNIGSKLKKIAKIST